MDAAAGAWSSYNILMHVSGELKQLDKVRQRHAEMLELGLRPDSVTYSVLIGAAGKALDLDLAFECFEQLKEDAKNSRLSDEDSDHDVTVSTVAFINLINACEACGQLDRAFDVFGEMKSSGFIPNVTTYTALLHACVEARRESEALNVLKEMVEKSLPVSACICFARSIPTDRPTEVHDARVRMSLSASPPICPRLCRLRLRTLWH